VPPRSATAAFHAGRALRVLAALRVEWGAGAAARKLEALRALGAARLARAADVERLHEALCFLHAYPDDAAVLAEVERLLGGFASRADLARHRLTLADTGIAGTAIRFRFYSAMAAWLVARFPGRVRIDWPEFDGAARLASMLHLLVPYCETPGLDTADLTPRRWIELLKGPDETDAEFLVRRFAALRGDEFVRETLYDALDVPLRVAAGPGPPSRTLARWSGAPVVFRRGALAEGRPDLRRESTRKPRAVRAVGPPEADRLIDLAREAMATRQRDLDAFANADRRDVRLVEFDAGLQFVCFGVVPPRRLVLEAVYGFLTLQNGVPAGYVLASSLFGSSEIAYNVFEAFRGVDAARVFARVVALARHLFGSDTLSIDPFQLGYGNDEGLRSGAWWFYYKLGFRPDHPDVQRLAGRELARMRRRPAHRSSRATLERLAAEPMFLHLGRQRADVLGRLDPGNVGLAVSRYLAARFGAEREAALRDCARAAARRLGVRSLAGWSAAEREAWQRWAPLAVLLPGVERWTEREKRACAAVMRAKGGRRESEFVARFDAHRPLRRAVARLASGN